MIEIKCYTKWLDSHVEEKCDNCHPENISKKLKNNLAIFTSLLRDNLKLAKEIFGNDYFCARCDKTIPRKEVIDLKHMCRSYHVSVKYLYYLEIIFNIFCYRNNGSVEEYLLSERFSKNIIQKLLNPQN